ncbi:Fanconi anemia group B protein isoform X1 [Thamnophis elegans]|uniref:Fanconi anemia group B protein isoform X1 n=1 Tax=Thamnophis elegans TaxID=35005 RepID=UPI0013767658|nr:Fanconi anemia group B protein isoform X1 [Thamnophis elegans]
MSMHQQEKLLSYNGILLLFQLSRGNNSQSDDITITTLHVKRMTFDNGTKLFNEVSTGSFCIYGEDIEIIHCSNASDFRTGILHPCILLKKKKKKKNKYILLLFHIHNKFELVLQFKLDYEIKEPVKLLAGPTIIWYYEGHLLHISPQTGTVLCAPIQFSSVQWAGQVKGEGIVVLGTRAAGFLGDNKQSNARSDLAIWGYECFAYGVDKQKVLLNASFLPHAYGSVVRCVYVCKTEIKRSTFKTSLIAVTCKGQLIFFQDGWPKHHLQLPYENPFSVQIASMDGDRQLVIVMFASGDVCAIWKHNLQVASCWENVKSVLVDDFAGIGTEQILIFFKSDSISETLNAFQITDFGNFNYESNINYESDCSAEEIQENRLRTIKALEARLQAGFASVRDIQQHLCLKEKVLIESCHALLDLVHDCKQRIPRIRKENLVSLWDETEEEFDNGVLTQTEDEEQIVKKVWYRVVDDQLIVGVEFMETFDFRQLSDASLSLIIGQKRHLLSPSKCHCRVVTVTKASEAEPLSCWRLEPLPKKIKLSCLNEESNCNGKDSEVKRNKAKAITAVTHLSHFLAWHEITCVVLLHAKKSSNSENWQKSKRLTLLCGDFLLSLVEISTGKLSINLKECPGSTEDLLALCAISHKSSFKIISSDCTLLPVNKRLLEQMECAPIEKYPDYMVCWKSGNLNGTLFKWNLKTPFEGFLTVFCRHQLALFQCLHAFIGLLPPTCKIKLLKLGNKNLLAEHLGLTLIKETEFFQNVLSSTLRQTENNFFLKNEGNKENNSASIVGHFKEAFIKEQKQSMLSMNRTVSGSLFRKYILNLFDLQMNSDMMSWLCSSF